MTTLVVCALLAVLMPYFAKVPVAMAMAKLGRYDNKHPRAQQAKLTGFGARTLAAHQNCFESLAVFAVAISVVFGTNSVCNNRNLGGYSYSLTHFVLYFLLVELRYYTFACMVYWLRYYHCHDCSEYLILLLKPQSKQPKRVLAL